MVAYSSLRDDLKTGDIILMSGESIFSWTIRRFTGSTWSHVGMVVRSEELDAVLLWESTTTGHPEDAATPKGREPKPGVQLPPLSKRVRDYDGKVAVRQLNRALTKKEVASLTAFRHEVKDRDYDYDALELLRSAMDEGLFWRNREDLQSFFCSELIAESYQRVGLLPDSKPSNEYTPDDFAQEVGEKLPLQGVTLDPIKKLDAG
ncbi:hypothetical protein CKO28_07945 [Rhodovibrio sodomensis]|uniref:Permuted papain-like amidase YaeF/Yiix C92 family enzyme n=1 Tax=Rhodovibrio sodomensis TaxID=1088 RepID=A0ABS1DBX8_9PROT|nr:YiiX/YebB-like N1pC/P60 family cysteine hydrolase [Rhodovibrio sodomensis]MBK1667966.1 hypothetical protein [Rhodovibrio sodomensis]